MVKICRSVDFLVHPQIDIIYQSKKTTTTCVENYHTKSISLEFLQNIIFLVSLLQFLSIKTEHRRKTTRLENATIIICTAHFLQGKKKRLSSNISGDKNQ